VPELKGDAMTAATEPIAVEWTVERQDDGSVVEWSVDRCADNSEACAAA
jgi:hypothetical protein